MTSKTAEREAEQRHFDAAWEAREASRQTLKAAGSAAGGPNKMAAMVRRNAEARAERLGGPDEAVAFGRIDLGEERTYYVGNHAILDAEHEPLVISWQSKAAAGYYAATINDPCGVTRKRVFDTRKNRIIDFEDTVYAALAGRLEELDGHRQWDVNDAVLADLESGRSGEMADIARTIHAAQYELIRLPLDEFTVIQGGPGTGKTAVALHRISWLLFNHRETLSPAECLVVGPNPTFIRYIRQVLPGLGDDDVAYRSLVALGPQSSDARPESAATARLKGDARMAVVLRTGMYQRVGVSRRTSVPLNVGRVDLDRGKVDAAVVDARRRSTSYNDGRQYLRQRLSEMAAGPRAMPVSAPAVDALLERVWPNQTPQSCLRDLLASRDRLLAACDEVDLRISEVTSLLREPADKLAREQWSDADVALLDELDELINGRRGEAYKHIVVDEAQDLSPMQMRSLRRRSRDGSMTIVGDVAQSTGCWARDGWGEVAEALAPGRQHRFAALELGYRVPRQVYELAAQLLPHAAPGIEPPRVVRDGPADPTLLEVETTALASTAVDTAREQAGKGYFVGLVCADDLRPYVIRELESNDVRWNDARDGQLSGSINLVDPAGAKGLEFDSVIIADPESIARLPHGPRLLYIAMTRTTKFLTIVHDGVPLPVHPPAEDGSSPAADVVTVADAPPSTSVPGLHGGGDPGADDAIPEETEAVAPARRPRRPARGRGMQQQIVLQAATWMAGEVGDALPPKLWPDFLEALRRELGVTDVELVAARDVQDPGSTD